MATPTTVLNMTFRNDADENMLIKLNHVDGDADGGDVNALMSAIVANGDIFVDEPVSKVGAQIVTTSVRDVIIV